MQRLPGDIVDEITKRLDPVTTWLVSNTCRTGRRHCPSKPSIVHIMTNMSSPQIMSWFANRGFGPSMSGGTLVYTCDLAAMQSGYKGYRHRGCVDEFSKFQWVEDGNRHYRVGASDRCFTGLRYGEYTGRRCNYYLCINASSTGNNSVLQWMYHCGVGYVDDIICVAEREGRLATAQWLNDHDYVRPGGTHDNYQPFPVHLSALQWESSVFHSPYPDNFQMTDVGLCTMRWVKWRQPGVSAFSSEDVVVYADNTFLQWVYQNASFGGNVGWRTSLAGNLSGMQWELQHGIELDFTVHTAALDSHRGDIIRWVRSL